MTSRQFRSHIAKVRSAAPVATRIWLLGHLALGRPTCQNGRVNHSQKSLASTRTRTRGRALWRVLCASGALIAAGARTTFAQQVADSAFTPNTGAPRWAIGTGPKLVLDEAHSNFHTLDGRYLAFGRMAHGIGFQVTPLRTQFTDESLRDVRVLVIANALNARNARNNWTLPTPSAFTSSEISAVRRFIERGGGLLLVADHMPFAGAAEDLGRAVGVQFANGFAFESYATDASSILVYRRKEGLVSPLPEKTVVDSIVAFTGSAFRLLGDGLPLMRLPKESRIWMPTTAWVFGDSVSSLHGDGWLQGAAINIGHGRVVILGEAAMLSAQRAGAARNPMGMNEPRASQNSMFASQLLRWLAGDGPAVTNARP